MLFCILDGLIPNSRDLEKTIPGIREWDFPGNSRDSGFGNSRDSGSTPIDLFLKGESKKSAFRLINTSEEKIAPKGHVNKLRKELSDLGVPLTKGDNIGNVRIWEQNYKMVDFNKGEDILIGYRCYTDGSKTKSGSGSGLCIMNDNLVVKTRALGLTRNATVFQSELQAIRLACSLIPECIPKNERITIMIDSQAAINALMNVDTKSKLV